MAVTNIFGRDFYQGLAADMATCVPRVEGALFWATDTLILYCWSGAAWNTVGAGIGGNVATDAIWDAKGDLAAGTGANTAVKVTVGTDGKYLKADSGAAAGVSWDTPAGNVAADAIWDAKGDLAVGTGANTASKLTVGTDAYTLVAASGEATGLKWQGHIGARVYNSAAETIGNAADTTLTFNSERYDTDTIHDTVTNSERLTCKTAGKYVITGSVEFASNATGVRNLWIALNAGATDLARVNVTAINGSATRMSVTTIYDLAVNDYVVLRVYQNSGGNLDVAAAGNRSPEFSMALLK